MVCGSYPVTSAFVPLTTYDTFPLGTRPVFTLKASLAVLEQAILAVLEQAILAVLEQAILAGGVCVGSTATAGGGNIRRNRVTRTKNKTTLTHSTRRLQKSKQAGVCSSGDPSGVDFLNP